MECEMKFKGVVFFDPQSLQYERVIFPCSQSSLISWSSYKNESMMVVVSNEQSSKLLDQLGMCDKGCSNGFSCLMRFKIDSSFSFGSKSSSWIDDDGWAELQQLLVRQLDFWSF